MNIGLIFRHTTYSYISFIDNIKSLYVYFVHTYIYKLAVTPFYPSSIDATSTGLFAHIHAYSTVRDVYIRPYYVVVVASTSSLFTFLYINIVHCYHDGLRGCVMVMVSRLCYLSNRTEDIKEKVFSPHTNQSEKNFDRF